MCARVHVRVHRRETHMTQRLPTVGVFALPGTFGHVWRHFQLLQLGFWGRLLAAMGGGQGCG